MAFGITIMKVKILLGHSDNDSHQNKNAYPTGTTIQKLDEFGHLE